MKIYFVNIFLEESQEISLATFLNVSRNKSAIKIVNSQELRVFSLKLYDKIMQMETPSQRNSRRLTLK